MFKFVAVFSILVAQAFAEPGCLVSRATPCTVVQWRANLQCRLMGTLNARGVSNPDGYLAQSAPLVGDTVPQMYATKLRARATYNNINMMTTNVLPTLTEAQQTPLLLAYEAIVNSVGTELMGSNWVTSSTRCGIGGTSGATSACGDLGGTLTAPTCPIP